MAEAVEAVIQELHEHRDKFGRWCRSLSEEELNRPVPGSQWLVRDFIAHLATIDRTVSAWFVAMHAPAPAEEPRPGPAPAQEGGGERFNIDTWNDRQVAKRRDWRLDQVFAEAAETREMVVQALRGFSDADLQRPMHFAGDSKRGPSEIKIGDYLTGWAKHDPIHVNDMLRALPQHRDDPIVRGWLDDPVVGEIARGYARMMGWDEGTDRG